HTHTHTNMHTHTHTHTHTLHTHMYLLLSIISHDRMTTYRNPHHTHTRTQPHTCTHTHTHTHTHFTHTCTFCCPSYVTLEGDHMESTSPLSYAPKCPPCTPFFSHSFILSIHSACCLLHPIPSFLLSFFYSLHPPESLHHQ